MKMYSDKKRNMHGKQGFTLVETLVSMLIFTLLTGVIIDAMVGSMKTLRVINEKVVATYLAQEAVEYIKNVRDTETLATSTVWYGGALTPCFDSNPADSLDIRCTVDTLQGSAVQCIGQNCAKIRFDDVKGVYTYTSGNETLYTRDVKLIHPDPSGTGVDEIQARVEVRWVSGTQQRSVTLYTSIFNWQQ